MARIRIFTGKGGVGKTSVAAASALKLAAEGHRTLLASTDAAHSVGDVLDRRIGAAIVRVAENLDAVELDADRIMEEEYGALVGSALSMASSMGGGDDDGEMPAMPGMDGLFALLKLIDFAEGGAYDRIVVDCAPTGETLSLLKYPERFGDFIERALPLKRKALKVGGPVIEHVMKIPLPDDALFDELSSLVGRLERLRGLLTDTGRVSLRVVTTAERIVVKEAKRAFAWLGLYGYHVDAVVVNRLYPEAALEGYFDGWTELQRASLDEIERSFSGTAVLRLMLRHGELRGADGLREAARELFGDVDLEAVLTPVGAAGVREGAGGCELVVPAPFFDKRDLDLVQDGDALVVSLANHRRRIPLPAHLRGRDVASARHEDGLLVVRFEES